MGKKRIIQKQDLTTEEGRVASIKTSMSKRKLSDAVVHVQATYNNTVIAITDRNGDIVMTSSAGALGFSGAKKGTPYASTKVAEFLGEKAKAMGIRELSILIKGVGAGRDAAARSLVGQGFEITSIRDITPIPHNGPRGPKPRRV